VVSVGPPFDMTDQVAVVTGASGAIGSHLVIELARRGASIVAIDILDGAEVVHSITERGGEVIAIVADLRDEKEAKRAFEKAFEWRGRIDVLVNMAGIYYGVPRIPFWEISGETWDEMIQSNMRTTFLACKEASGAMRAARKGRIVNVSSNVSVFGMSNFMHYAAAKAALVGMTRSMARELGPYGVAVNAVAPGLVNTSRSQGELAPEYLQVVVNGQCICLPIEVSDVVNAVAFLSSDESRLITGQTLLINGGAAMGSF
jgi:3-oxoacyl-[acyl-carrier protein] reductase